MSAVQSYMRFVPILTRALQKQLHFTHPRYTSSKSATQNTISPTVSDNGKVQELAPVQTQDVLSHGTKFHVGYLDVGPRDGPVLLGCHGVPGSVHHFSPLLPPLLDEGIRIIIPEFPGYGNTTIEDPKRFDEKTSSRATFVMDFLRAIGINRVSVVAGHSVGGYTALALAAQYDEFDSLVHLSGLGIVPHKAVSPYWMSQMYASLLRNPLTSPVMSASLKFMYERRGFSISNADGLLTGMMTVDGFDYPMIRQCTEKVRQKQLPAFFTASQNDRICEWPLQLQLAQACGLHDNNVSYYGDNDQLIQGPKPGESEDYPQGVFYETGGHVVYRKHTDTVARGIVNLVKHLHGKQKG